ncbi:conserved hypothetical protein [Candidatus Desulfarcum epimagneticum]|uniref:site-specific DNA-methyltransferase (adenine-specific) n=1 Tax=uncultured Desulfobacteraceae bacterium TaxID=218296 RepID=A0A484HKG0_9BACT|nr:conserved hypothetical protein [uncultured Desulfobacteraceae bacterium]
MLDRETKQRINSARQILVGKVPDPKAQVEQITNALIYKFMDDMDRENEELGGAAQFLIGDLKEFSWSRLTSRELSGLERWNLYTRALSSFARSNQIPELFRAIFKDAYLPYRDPETLNLFLKEINGFSYSNSENLGNAFEYLLSILGSQGDAGQFRTPRHIIDFIVETINPQKTDRILDPACGTAGFLISSYKHIRRENSSDYKPDAYTPTFAEAESPDISTVEIQKNGQYKGDQLNPDDRKRLANHIVGYDISPDMVRLSLVNLYLHGFSTPQIYEYDTLTYEERWGEDFDIILANPPFMTPKGGIRPHKRFQVSANRSEVLFVDYIAEHLAINGKAGIIVPEGIVFQSSNAYKALRKMLVDENYLYAVASLPPGVFQPYSGVKTSILFLDKSLAKQNDEILFVKVENDGFDLGAQRRRIDKNDLPRAFEILKAWQKGEKTESKIALWVEKKKISENGDYNLTGDRYREVMDYSRVRWPLVGLGNERYFSVKSGGTPSSKNSEYWGGDINWATLADLPANNVITNISKTQRTITELGLKKSSAKLLPPKTVLVSSRATIGRIGIAKVPLATNQGFKNIVIKNFHKADENYVAMILTKLVPRMDLMASGGTYKEISKTSFSNLEIPLPPVEIQKEIVTELDSYQKVIDGARQVAETWRPRIKIDPDWPLVRLEDVVEVISGQSPQGKYYNEKGQGIPFYQGKTEFTEKIIGSPKKWTTQTTKIAFPNDILMSVRAPVGPVNFTMRKICIGRGLAAIRCDTNKIVPDYLFFVLKEKESEIQGNKGATFASINRKDIQQIQIPIPSLKIQKKIVPEIEKEQKMVESCKKLIGIHEQKIKDKIAEVWGEG